MNDLIPEIVLVYYITKDDLQREAQRRIGRKLENHEFNTKNNY